MTKIGLKLAYYGPGLAGKLTNLHYIFDRTHPGERWEWAIPVTTFDFEPKSLEVNGKGLRIRVGTHTAARFPDPARLEVLENVDGVIFVADSQAERCEANGDCLDDLESNLRRRGVELAELPHVLQYNKQDLPNALPITKLDAQLNRYGAPCFGACARKGEGVFDTLKSVIGLALDRIRIEPPAPGSSTTPYRD